MSIILLISTSGRAASAAIAKDGITIKQALTLADEKLYDVKKYRTKDVAKSVK